MVKGKTFSDELERWLRGNQPKTLENLIEVFAEKSFAIAFLLLMFIPALPLPTGGITHVFEVIVMLLALELIIGRRTIWLPQRWQKTSLGLAARGKALPFVIRRIRWFERFSRPRLHRLVKHPQFGRGAGLIVLALTLAAFLAPPFSGLDTLPSMGVVVIALSIILEDIMLWFVGLGIGVIGITLQLFFAGAIVQLIRTLL
jgi:hypothetical protein